MNALASRSVRRFCFALVLVSAPLAAATTPDVGSAEQQHADSVPMPSPLDKTTAALMRESLDIERRGQSIRGDVDFPPYSRVSIYLGVSLPGLVVDSLNVSIDNGKPIEVHYDTNAAIALLKGGLAPVSEINVTPGRHQLQATVVGHYTDAKKGAPPVTQVLTTSFDKDETPAELEVRVLSTGFITRHPSIELIQWARAS